jgi:arabinofuranosyltransferase
MSPSLAFGAAAAVFAFLIHRFWFVTDDAFISFRYAANWADGLGLRYNLGTDPPVEGFSNFLWTALMAGIRLLGGRMALLAPWISCLLGFCLLLLTFRFLLKRIGRGALPGLFFLALFPPLALWSTGGLETMLFALLLFVLFERLLGDRKRAHGLSAGLAAALLVLTRPEGAIWALALCGMLALARIARGEKVFDRDLCVTLALFLAVAAAGLWARFETFEKLLPNTAYAKVGISGPTLCRGLFYFLDFGLTFFTPALLIATLPFVIGKRTDPSTRAAARSAAVIIGGFAAYTISAGGDFMAMGRFLAPAAPFFAILFAALWQRIVGRASPPHTIPVLLFSGCLVIQVLPAFDCDLLPRSVHEALHFRLRNKGEIRSEFGQWSYMERNSHNWEATGRRLKSYASEGDSIVCPNIGAIGYFSGLFIYDTCGLIDPEVASRVPSPDGSPKSAGHDKIVPARVFLKHKPTYYRTYVVKAHEAPLLVERLGKGGLPRRYVITTLPLEGVEGALPETVLVLVKRRKETPDESGGEERGIRLPR